MSLTACESNTAAAKAERHSIRGSWLERLDLPGICVGRLPWSTHCCRSCRFSFGLSTRPYGRSRDLPEQGTCHVNLPRPKQQGLYIKCLALGERALRRPLRWAQGKVAGGAMRQLKDHSSLARSAKVAEEPSAGDGENPHLTPSGLLSRCTRARGQMTSRQSCSPIAWNSSTQTP